MLSEEFTLHVQSQRYKSTIDLDCCAYIINYLISKRGVKLTYYEKTDFILNGSTAWLVHR
jgi:hypothetical protein